MAEVGLFRPRWSEHILDETEKAITRISNSASNTARQRASIQKAFPDADVPLDENINVAGFLPDPDDEHVLQAAIVARCETLVTDNLADFPQDVLDLWSIEVVSTDVFISNAMDLDHAVAI